MTFERTYGKTQRLQHIDVVHVVRLGCKKIAANVVKGSGPRRIGGQKEIAQARATQQSSHLTDFVVPGLTRHSLLFEEILELAVRPQAGSCDPRGSMCQDHLQKAEQQAACSTAMSQNCCKDVSARARNLARVLALPAAGGATSATMEAKKASMQSPTRSK